MHGRTDPLYILIDACVLYIDIAIAVALALRVHVLLVLDLSRGGPVQIADLVLLVGFELGEHLLVLGLAILGGFDPVPLRLGLLFLAHGCLFIAGRLY